MCLVSNIGDMYGKDKWPQQPWYPQQPTEPSALGGYIRSHITRAEFEALKKEVTDLRALLKIAKDYDEKEDTYTSPIGFITKKLELPLYEWQEDAVTPLEFAAYGSNIVQISVWPRTKAARAAG
jgi:hypothetical protein